MKFVKEVTGEKMAIPAAALKLCGFENGDKAELHALPSAAIILKQKMTAMEVIRAMDALHQLTVDISVHLARASGPCDGCDGDCPFDGLEMCIRDRHEAQLGGVELDYQKKAFEVEISNGGPRGYETCLLYTSRCV